MPTRYEWLLILHILSIIVALSPAAAHTLLLRQAAAEGPEAVRRAATFAARCDQRIYGTALVLAGLFGILMVLTEDYWEFSDSWVSWAFLVWIAMNGVLHALIVPGERAMAEGDEEGQRKVMVGGPLMTVLVLVMLYLMIVKP